MFIDNRLDDNLMDHINNWRNVLSPPPNYTIEGLILL